MIAVEAMRVSGSFRSEKGLRLRLCCEVSAIAVEEYVCANDRSWRIAALPDRRPERPEWDSQQTFSSSSRFAIATGIATGRFNRGWDAEVCRRADARRFAKDLGPQVTARQLVVLVLSNFECGASTTQRTDPLVSPKVLLLRV